MSYHQFSRRLIPVVVLSAVAATIASPAAAGQIDKELNSASVSSQTTGAADVRHVVLQMNLCNSGYANCFTGNAVFEATGVVRAQRPDVISLNEICYPADTNRLGTVMQDEWSGQDIVTRFAQVYDGNGVGKKACKQGGLYGDAIVYHRAPSASDLSPKTGRFTSQDTSNENRSYVCGGVAGAWHQCTTHLSTTRSVALQQCEQLLGPITQGLWAAKGRLPTVVSGDMNLTYGGSPDVQSCTPSGWYRKGDNSVQHQFADNSLVFVRRDVIAMTETDHPGLQVTYQRSAGPPPPLNRRDNVLESGESLSRYENINGTGEGCEIFSTNRAYFLHLCGYRIAELRRFSDNYWIWSNYPNGDSLGDWTMLMQTDGNLVDYEADTGRVLWSTNTVGNPGAQAVLQDDGNFVIYSASGQALWSSASHPPYNSATSAQRKF